MQKKAFVLWLFLMVPCVGLQCVIVIFPDHTHLLYQPKINMFLLFLRKKKGKKQAKLVSFLPDISHGDLHNVFRKICFLSKISFLFILLS